MKNLEIYCITNKVVNFLDNTEYKIGWVGKDKAPDNYITCNTKDNIFFKEKYYSELTFQYWYWKNVLDINNNRWIGFCQRRRFWSKKKLKNTNQFNFKDDHLNEQQNEWNNYDSIICNPIKVSGVKKMKLLKRGFRSLVKDPSIFFNEKKQTIALHFDMHHGYGNLKKAIEVMDKQDKYEFLNYVNFTNNYNPHIMFIAKPNIHKKWFETLFPWLLRCEKIFGFEPLNGYDTQRLYAYLAERYLSFWFKKYTKSLNWPWEVWEEK